jgi:hypothetical protein
MYDEDGSASHRYVPGTSNYLIQRDDGQYDIYMNDVFLGTVAIDKITGIMKDFPILDDKQETTG